MAKMKLEFEEKHHILEVDGVEYEIPQRTVKMESLMKETLSDTDENKESETNTKILTALFGEKIFKQMFPEKENINLDKLAKVTKAAVFLYMHEYNEMQGEGFKREMASSIAKTVKASKPTRK